MKRTGLTLLIALLSFVFVQAGVAVTDATWDELLKKHVSADGYVDYEGFKKDRGILEDYVIWLRGNTPKGSWSPNKRLAYYINVYNANAVFLIAEEYPIKSIMDLNDRINIPGVNSIFEKKIVQIWDAKMSLNDLENKIRKEFGDSRIHFALNCTAVSCPVLRAEAYSEAKLEAQLNEQLNRFMGDKTKNEISAKSVKISKIFEWYKKDFVAKKETLIDYLNKVQSVNIEPKAKITFLEYDWKLNDVSLKK